MTQLPVTIVAGYLGAGKTTLVNSLLRNSAGRRVAVLVNDFGDINIDADLIEAAEDDVMRLTGGCACCRIGNDFVSALTQVTAMAQYDHVLVEASGVSQPARLAQAVPFVLGARLWGVIVVCDATVIRTRLSDHYVGELVRQQVAEAELLVLNKCDAVNATELKFCKEHLASRNPNATLVETLYGNIGWDEIDLSNVADMTHSPAAENCFRSAVLRGNQPVRAADLRAQIAKFRPLRVKGYVIVDRSHRMLVELAGDTWVWPRNDQTVYGHELVAIFA